MASQLELILGSPDFSETHSTQVAAAPDRVYAALSEVKPSDVTTTRLLMGLRTLPARLMRRAREERAEDVPLVTQFVDNGFFSLLSEELGREIILGMIGQPWKVAGGETRQRFDLAMFSTFAEAGFVRVAWNFYLEPRDGVTLLSTTTLIAATDEAAKRSFGRYWFVVKHGSGLIRKDLLRAIKRRAEVSAKAAQQPQS